MRRDRLTALDGSFLRMETDSAHMHIGWKGLFAARPERGPLTLGELRSLVAGRLRHAERFRQRLAFPPGRMAEPVWVDDARFDLAWHVHALAGDDETLSRARFDECCDEIFSQPLERSRALWRVALAPRLDDGRIGIVMKAHHAMVDGTSAVQLALLLLDGRADAEPETDDDGWTATSPPGAARLAAEALVDTGEETLRMAGAIARAASPAAGLRLAGTLRRAAMGMGDDLLRAAPASYVNTSIGPRRMLVHHTCEIAPLLEAKARHGVSLNDIALTAVAGALRTLAMRAGRMPASLKVLIPVNRRPADDLAAPGNRIAFVCIDLPVQIRRVDERLQAVRRQTMAFKRDDRAGALETVLSALQVMPDPVKEGVTRLASSSRAYNLTISNVPGPRAPVYLCGALLEEAAAVIPLSEGHALSIGILSHDDRITFSGYFDPEALPYATELPSALAAAIDEIGNGFGRRIAPRRRGELSPVPPRAGDQKTGVSV